MNKTALLLTVVIILIVALMYNVIFNQDKDCLLLLDHHAFRNDPAAQPDPLLGFRLRPSVSMYGFRHNKYGFIGPEFEKGKPKGTFRIFCLGGSTTLGAGVETDSFSYPEILQGIFNRTSTPRSNKIQIINAGVFGYNSAHTVIRVTKLLDAFNPDMYIVMDGLNDLDTAQALTLTQLENIRGKNTHDYTTGFGLQNINEKFSLVGYKDNMLRAIDYANNRGIMTVLVSDPMQMSPSYKPKTYIKNTDLSQLLSFGRKVLPEINNWLAITKNVPFVNVQTTVDLFLSSPQLAKRVWSEDLHLTRYGYYLVAKDVYRQLMGVPAIQGAVGTPHAATDEELDALFPELVQWRPADGSGWSQNALPNSAVVNTANCNDSKPADDGWSFFTRSNPTLPAEISLAFDSGISRFRFYPRIQSLNDTVALFQLGPNGQRYPLFELKKPAEDGLWTPQTAWYEVQIPAGQDGQLVFCLTGENAQLWHKGDSVLFTVE